jgi:hypothetical protein
MDSKTVYWHRELPPADAEGIGDHTIEAVRNRVPGTLAHRDEMWDRCYRKLMERARRGLEQEGSRVNHRRAAVKRGWTPDHRSCEAPPPPTRTDRRR